VEEEFCFPPGGCALFCEYRTFEIFIFLFFLVDALYFANALGHYLLCKVTMLIQRTFEIYFLIFLFFLVDALFDVRYLLRHVACDDPEFALRIYFFIFLEESGTPR